MLLKEYIDRLALRDYPMLSIGDRVDAADSLLTADGYRCAPVLHEGKPVALLTLERLFRARRESGEQEDSRPLSSLSLPPVLVAGRDEHLLDIVGRLLSDPGEIVAVVDEEGRYCAVIEKRRLAGEVAALFHLSEEEGVTLELDMPPSGVRISEVVSVLEKNDAVVQAFGIRYPSIEGEEGPVVYFRIQIADLFLLRRRLDAYGYRIRYISAGSGSEDEELREKALEFIRYLDM